MVARAAPRAAGLAIALLLAGPGPPPASGAPSGSSSGEEERDGATSEWNQWGGNAARTFAADVDPVRSEPRVLWRRRLIGAGAREVVSWGGVVFTVALRSGDQVLQAFSLADGTPLGSRSLGKSADPGHLAVWQGTVIVSDGSGIRGIRHRGSSFTPSWTVKDGDSTAPAVDEGVLYAARAARVWALDASSGKETRVSGVASISPPVVVRGPGDRSSLAGVTVGEKSGYQGTYAVLQTEDLPLGTGPAPATPIAPFSRDARYGTVLRLLRIPSEDPGESGWFCISSVRFKGKEANFPSCAFPDAVAKEGPGGGLCTIDGNPTARHGRVYGFGGDGDLVSIRANGAYSVIVEAAKLPRGAKPGPASRAREVACFGNWAADLDSRRVLWCLPDLSVEGPAYPVADRALVLLTKDDEILCMTDRPADGAPSAAAAGTPAPPGASAPPPTAGSFEPPPPPTGRDGLLLADGREIEGAVEILEGARIRVTPGSGAPVEAPAHEVLLALSKGKVLHRGREAGVLQRWRATLHGGAALALEDLHRRFARESLLQACRKLLEEARDWGLPDARAAELSRLVAGQTENKNAENRVRLLQPLVEEKRAALHARFLEAAAWCRDRDLPAAAACILGDADRILPGSEEVEAGAREVLPRGFPWADARDAGRRWIAWARETVSADASFLPPDHPARRWITRGPWSDTAAVIVLRTPSVIFRSRNHDPAVVGRCLRNAEWTVRALTELLGQDTIRPLRSDHDRLDVRLHACADDYRKEEVAGGGYPMVWSAGYYSPGEGVSRFFVPAEGLGDPLGRGLFQTLAHEITHHFVEQRWKGAAPRGESRAGTRGYWCVEGLARFVEDQVVEMDRRGLRFDDPTVPSIDSAAQAAEKGVLFRPARLLDATGEDFGKLSTKELLRVALRNTLQTRILSSLSLFYEQSGATVFYLVNERGRDGRLAFLAYLSTYYSGQDPGPGWKALGFCDEEDCDASVKGFLGRHR